MKNEDINLTLNGGLDTRSADGACGTGWFRILLNVDGGEQWQMCALSGWRRRMAEATCYNNQDLHDQMVEAQFYATPYNETQDAYSVQVGTTYPDIPIFQNFPEVVTELCGETLYLDRTCRESFTFLKSVTNLRGGRKLLAGTHSRLYASDDAGGNWRILADGLGGACNPSTRCSCSPIRLNGASLGNYTLFTNNTDEVLFWLFDSGPEGCYGWSADYVQDLRYLNLSRASGVVEFQGVMLLWDVRMDGVDYPSRLVWSDYNDPLSWIPGGESIAGFQDFGRGEKIIDCLPIGNGKLRIYTTQAIYDAVIVQDERVFSIQERYRLPGGVTTNLPAFRHGIANCGSYHIFVSQDEVLRMAEYDTEPQILDWIHRSSGVIFNGISEGNVCGYDGITSKDPINRNACDQLTARWVGSEKCVIISWPTGDSECPDLSLFLWPDTHKATIVDYGFTEIAEHQPDTSISWRDFLGVNGICDPADGLLDKEGESCPVTFVEQEYTGFWNETEDPDLPMDPNSISALFCDMCLEDLCRNCDSDTAIVLASASDKTLKEYTPGRYVREELTDITDRAFPAPDTGTYQDQSYPVLIQSDAMQRGGPIEKTFRAMLVGYSVGESGNTLCAQAGGAWSPSCLDWEHSKPFLMECPDPDPKKRRGRPARFGFMTTGAWLAWRISTQGCDFCAINLTINVTEGGCW